MDRKDALADILDAMRAGKDRERALAAHPQHAEDLRDELDLAEALRAHARTLPAAEDAAAERARDRMSAALNVARAQQRAGAAPPVARPAFRFPLLRGLAVAAVVLVAVFGLAGVLTDGVPSFNGTRTAEAETLDGVVVETSEASVLLQTAKGIESISFGSDVAITDESGAKLTPASLEVGQVLSVTASRVRPGEVRARQVQRKATRFEDWCRDHPVLCEEAAPRVREGIEERCRVQPQSCSPLLLPPMLPPGDGRPPIVDRPRLQELANRCQEAGGEACEELRRLCRAEPLACTVLAGWLRTYLDLPEDTRERLRVLTERCRAGSALDCRELRVFCERTPGLCPPPAPAPSGDRILQPTTVPQQQQPQVAPRPLQQQTPRTAPLPTRQPVPTIAAPRGGQPQQQAPVQTQPPRPVR